MTPFLTTERLSFRELNAGDLDFLAEMLCDPQVMRYYPYVFDRAGVQDWLNRVQERQARDGLSFWCIANKTTDEPIGQVGILLQEVDGVTETEIGYMLLRRHWHQGYAHEATVALRDYAFSTLGRERVISLIRPVNIPSQRVALAYGAKPEKLVTWRDYEHLVFSLAKTVRT